MTRFRSALLISLACAWSATPVPCSPAAPSCRALAATPDAPFAADDQRIGGSGVLRADSEVRVITSVPGTVKELFFKEGDPVRAGAAVAIIDSPELRTRLSAAQTGVDRTRAALREAEERLSDGEKKLAQKAEFFRRDLIARREVAEAEGLVQTLRAEKDLAAAQVSQAETALAQARYQVRLTRIEAPANGVVTGVFAGPGEYAGNAGTLLTIGRLETLRVLLELPERDAARLRLSMDARVTLASLPGRIFRGAVTGITPAASGARTPAVEVRVDNPEGLLKPGMKVAVFFPSPDPR